MSSSSSNGANIKELQTLLSDAALISNETSDRVFESISIEVASKARDALSRGLPIDVSHEVTDMNMIFCEFLTAMEKIPLKSSAVSRYLELIGDIYGDEHVVLADLFTTVAKLRIKQGNLQDALNFSGRALLIRIRTSGLLDEETANAHFNLGLVYRLLGENANSLKELHMCRSIRTKIFGNMSLPVANCDLGLALTEKIALNFPKAYLHYFNCYRTRKTLLGPDHNQSMAVEESMKNYRILNGERLFCSVELKDHGEKVVKWNESDAASKKYAIYIYICRLRPDEVMNETQLKEYFLSALKFHKSKEDNSQNNSNSSNFSIAGGGSNDNIEHSAGLKSESASMYNLFVVGLVASKDAAIGPGRLRGKSAILTAGSGVNFSQESEAIIQNTTPSKSNSHSNNNNDNNIQSMHKNNSLANSQTPMQTPPLANQRRPTTPWSSSSKPSSSPPVPPANVNDPLANPSIVAGIKANALSSYQSPSVSDRSSKTMGSSPSLSRSPSMQTKASPNPDNAKLIASNLKNTNSMATSIVVDQSSNPIPKKSFANPSPNKSGGGNLDVQLTATKTGLAPQSPKQITSALVSVASRLANNNINMNNNITSSSNINKNVSSPQAVNSPSKAVRPFTSPHYQYFQTHSSNNKSSSPGGQKKSLLTDMRRQMGVGTINSNSHPHQESSRNFPGNDNGGGGRNHGSNNPLSFLSSYPGVHGTTSNNHNTYNNQNNNNANNHHHNYSNADGNNNANDNIHDDRSVQTNSNKVVVPKDLPESEDVYVMDQAGRRILIRRASTSDLMNSIKSEMLAVGLLLRFKSEVSVVKQKSDVPSILASSAPLGDDAPAVDEANPKNALHAMFAKRSAPPASVAVSAMPSETNAISAKPNKEPPRPPPLPTSWPPIPYNDSALAAGGGDGSGGGVGLSLDAAFSTDKSAAKSTGPKMKTIQGVEVISSVEGTMWEGGEDGDQFPPMKDLFGDIDEEFGAVAAKKPATSKIGGGAGGPMKIDPDALKSKTEKKEKPLTAIDAGRTQNVSIMLAKFGKRSVTDICKAVTDFNYQALGPTAVSSLSAFCPSPDEVVSINNFISKHGIDKLSKPEAYLLEMSKIGKLEQKLSAMSCILSVHDSIKSISQGCESILQATDEVMGSARLKYIFKVVLNLYNTITQKANPSAAAVVGFKLSTIPKLSQTKTNSGETIEQYVVNKIHGQMPEALEVRGDMPSLDDAKEVIFSRMRSDLTRIQAGIDVMKILLANENETSETLAIIQSCMDECTRLHAKGSSSLKDATTDYENLCKYFGMDFCEPEVLFSILMQFLASLDKAVGVLVEKEKRLARSAAAKGT